MRGLWLAAAGPRGGVHATRGRGGGREGDKVTPEHLPFTIHRNGVVDMQRWDNELSRGGAIDVHFRRRPLRDCVLSARHGGSPARSLG